MINFTRWTLKCRLNFMEITDSLTLFIMNLFRSGLIKSRSSEMNFGMLVGIRLEAT